MKHLIFHEFDGLKEKWKGENFYWGNDIPGDICSNALGKHKLPHDTEIFFLLNIGKSGKRHLFVTETGIYLRNTGDPSTIELEGWFSLHYSISIKWDLLIKCNKGTNNECNVDFKNGKTILFPIRGFKEGFIIDILNCINNVITKREELLSYKNNIELLPSGRGSDEADLLDNVLRIRPSALDFIRRGELCSNLNDAQSAIIAYQKALECLEREPFYLNKDIREYEIWEKIALLKEKTGDFDLARYDLNNAILHCEDIKALSALELHKARIRKSFIDEFKQLPFHQKQRIIFVRELPPTPDFPVKFIDYEDVSLLNYAVRGGPIEPYIVYVLNPVSNSPELIRLNKFHATLLGDKYDETIDIARSLGAKRIFIEESRDISTLSGLEEERKYGSKQSKSREQEVSGEVGHPAFSVEGGISWQESESMANNRETSAHRLEKRNISSSRTRTLEFDPDVNKIYSEKDLPPNLKYYPKDADLTQLVNSRLGGASKDSFILEQKTDYSINETFFGAIDNALSKIRNNSQNLKVGISRLPLNTGLAHKQKDTIEKLDSNFKQQKTEYKEVNNIRYCFDIEYPLPKMVQVDKEEERKQLEKFAENPRIEADKNVMQKIRKWQEKHLGVFGKSIKLTSADGR